MAVTVEIPTTLDGFVAGPNPTLQRPLGNGGDLGDDPPFRVRR